MFVFNGWRQAAARRLRFHPLLGVRLPRMSEETLLRQMRRLSPEEAALVRARRYLPLPGKGLQRPCVVTDEASRRVAEEAGCLAIAEAQPEAFLRAMERAWGEGIIREASWALAGGQPHFSAYRRFSQGQKEMLLLALVALAMLAIAWPTGMLLVTSALFGIFYLSLAALHFSAARHRAAWQRISLLRDEQLPVYTVLVPLFRESRVIPQLLQALARLDYPTEKLDIKLLVEEVDAQTRAALARYVLPHHIEVLTVPRGAPQTKPRALNYGLAFARGALLTIYDAEDIPHPGQLRLAASMFAQADERLACLQAPLGWYNAGTSFFTRMIAVDYAAHFHVILPWLHRLGLPLPLGGTSNHFRIRALLEAGGWDPFNVTEDADLGLRLARKGYRTGTLPRLLTLEEACADYGCWRNQRARWIKGWLQTFLVHQRAPARLLTEVGAGGYFVLYALLGAGVFASLLHPLFLLLTVLALAQPEALPGGLAGTWLAAQGVVVFVAGYAGAIAAAIKGLRRTHQMHLLPWLVFLPFYWLLVSLAAWLALWDFIRRPHHWRKTEHGYELMFK